MKVIIVGEKSLPKASSFLAFRLRRACQNANSMQYVLQQPETQRRDILSTHWGVRGREIRQHLAGFMKRKAAVVGTSDGPRLFVEGLQGWYDVTDASFNQMVAAF